MTLSDNQCIEFGIQEQSHPVNMGRGGKVRSPSWNTRRLSKDKLQKHFEETRLIDELGWVKSAGSFVQRRECLTARRRFTRSKGDPLLREAWKTEKSALRQGIKKSRLQCWKELIDEVEKDPWGLAFKIVTKKLVTRRKNRAWIIPIESSTFCGACFHTYSRSKDWTEFPYCFFFDLTNF